MSKPVTEQECRRDLKEMQEAVERLSNEIMPRLIVQLKWRFFGFWCFLWLFIFNLGVVFGIGLGVGILLLGRSVYNVCDCKYCITKTKETIAYIEGYMKANKETT